MFTAHGEVENGLLAVLMRESELIAVCFDTIGESCAVLRQNPFIGALLAFGFGYWAVLITPALVTERDPFGMWR